MKKLLIILLAITIFAAGCYTEKDADKPTETGQPIDAIVLPITDEVDFDAGDNGFSHGFADYPKGQEEFYQLYAQVDEIPGLATNGYMLTGSNHSDDLLMYITKTYNVEPNTEYSIAVYFDVATNVPGGMMGVGGSPGSSVYIKTGASANEIKLNADDMNHLRINWDIGNQASDGTDGWTLGNIEKIDSEDESYQLKGFSTEFKITSNDNGQLHILIGIDSGFESITKVYIDNVRVIIS